MFLKFLLGNGTLRPELRAELESEGLVLLEEGLSARLKYTHFKMPGRRFHGKITPERVGLGISEARVVVFCKSGRAKLINSRWDNPRLDAIEISSEDEDKLVFKVDYDRMGEPKISGVITVTVKTPNAMLIESELKQRIGHPYPA
ncbi:MAG: hypothetical protein M3355_03660 [Actinomycetota bacterium]|nr:hypothetical protein [Actinomycetota bacterium]